MSGFARREQLVAVGRSLFAEKGFGATSVEEIAARAKVSKPVVYEHFGGKEGLYAVIVDREVQALISSLQSSLESSERPRLILENATLGLLDYIERNTDGFRVLVRDAPSDRTAGSFSSVMGDVATSVEHIIAEQFKRSDFDATWSPLYAQMLVGLIAVDLPAAHAFAVFPLVDHKPGHIFRGISQEEADLMGKGSPSL